MEIPRQFLFVVGTIGRTNAPTGEIPNGKNREDSEEKNIK